MASKEIYKELCDIEKHITLSP